MTNELIFKTNSKFKSASYDEVADNWYIVFDNEITFNISAIWRLLSEEQIHLVSLDHGHQFGLPKPVDIQRILSDNLAEQSLLEIKVKQKTADLLLTFTNNFELEVFISSTGYETYNFSINKSRYIGMGRGDIAIFDE